MGVAAVELHTGQYALSAGDDRQVQLELLEAAGRQIVDAGMLLHAGHGLNYRNVQPVASIDQTCVGCGNCGEVADTAVLCPSFYQADVVHNPTKFERWRAEKTGQIIRWLQDRRDAKRLRNEGVAT